MLSHFIYRLHFVSPSNLFRQAAQFGAEAVGLGFVVVHDGVLKQRIQPLPLQRANRNTRPLAQDKPQTTIALFF